MTVGTTRFDALVSAVDSENVRKVLAAKGYTHLLIQLGRGSYLPTKSDGDDGSLAVDYFTFSSSIADYLRSASLVISHAGMFVMFVFYMLLHLFFIHVVLKSAPIIYPLLVLGSLK